MSSHKITNKRRFYLSKHTEIWDLKNPKDAREFIMSIRVGAKKIFWILDDYGNKIPVDKASDTQIMVAIKHIARAMRKGEGKGKDH